MAYPQRYRNGADISVENLAILQTIPDAAPDMIRTVCVSRIRVGWRREPAPNMWGGIQ